MMTERNRKREGNIEKVREGVCEGMRGRKRERKRERLCVFGKEREREREIKCVFVCVYERERIQNVFVHERLVSPILIRRHFQTEEKFSMTQIPKKMSVAFYKDFFFK